MITLLALWIAWCTLHSFLISPSAQKVAKRMLGRHFLLYRLLYVAFSLLSLLPILWYQFLLPQQVIIPGNICIRFGQILLLFYAGFMFWAGSRVYDIDYFLGLTQWRSRSRERVALSLPFHTNGVLAHVRHPWYSGGIAFLWGIGSVTDVFLLTRTLLTLYILAGTLLEESRLNKELGKPYAEYCRRVPMLFPWKIFYPDRS